MTLPEGPQSDPRPRVSTAGFVVIQIVLIGAGVAWALHRGRELVSEQELPALRPEPLAVSPLYDDPEVVSDEQLRRLLSRLGLRLRGAETSIGYVDHSLRFWGSSVDFDDPELVSGEDMRRLLTDHRRFVELFGLEQAPLLIDEGPGVRVRALEGHASASHVDHTLASLAEIGTPLDFPIVTPRRQTELRAVLEQSLRNFSLNQVEYEWSALSYVLFLQPTSRWLTAEGQAVTFDRLAERLMREQQPRGVCAGNHRLHSLVAFLRVDELLPAAGELPILDPETRGRVLEYLREMTARLVRHQHPEGFWNADWPNSAPASSEPSEQDPLSLRLIATGHALEWWALAPAEVHPPRATVMAAGQWLVRTIDRLSAEEIEQNYSFLTHVGRALALWRGRLPEEVDLGQ